MPHNTPHHFTSPNGTHASKMPSSFRNLTRRASQFLKRDRSRDQQESVPVINEDSRKHISFDEGCLPPLLPLRKRSKRSPAPADFSIAPDSPLRGPVPQLPELSDLGKRKVVKKAKSLAVIPVTPQRAASDLADEAMDAFKNRNSLDVKRDLKMPGAFPKSSSPMTSEPSPVALMSPIPSPLKLWLTSEKKLNPCTDTVIRVKPGSLTLPSDYSRMNESADTVIRHRAESEQSISGPLLNAASLPRSDTLDSAWTTTTEPDTEPGTPLARQPSDSEKGKEKTVDSPSLAPQQPVGMIPSASTTSSVRDLPPHKSLRHQTKLPSQRRWINIDTESHTSEKEKAEQAALRRKFHLPSSTSRSKLQWDDLSSNVSSLNSIDARNMRKDLRLPSRRVSTPNLSGLRRAQEYVERLSEQPEQGNYDPFFDSSKIAEEVFDNSQRTEEQASDAFFSPTQSSDQPIPHKLIINNLYEAVKRVDIEMARVQLENRQLIQSEEQANARAAFWEGRAGGLEETMKDRQREKEELLEMMMERGVPVPERLLERWEEAALEHVPEEAAEDVGYEGDVSGTTQQSYEETMTTQPGDLVHNDGTD